jgi:hypothetical protein
VKSYPPKKYPLVFFKATVYKLSLSLITFLCILLLVLGQDIELNPGPAQPPMNKGMSFVHLNVQSLYMTSISNHPRVKLDEIITTYVVNKAIDLICMSETWLNDQISNTVIEIPGYKEPFRKDRKDRIGGGVYVPTSPKIS